jgi:hypothetical protein
MKLGLCKVVLGSSNGRAGAASPEGHGQAIGIAMLGNAIDAFGKVFHDIETSKQTVLPHHYRDERSLKQFVEVSSRYKVGLGMYLFEALGLIHPHEVFGLWFQPDFAA